MPVLLRIKSKNVTVTKKICLSPQKRGDGGAWVFLQEPQGRALNGLCVGCLLESMQLSLSLFCSLARLAGGLGSLPSLLPLLLDGEES